MKHKSDSNAAIGKDCDKYQIRLDMREHAEGRHLLTVYVPAGNDYEYAKGLAKHIDIRVVVSA